MKGPQNAGVVHDGVSANQRGMSSIGPDIGALLPTSCRKTKGAGGYGSMPKNVGIGRTKVFVCPCPNAGHYLYGENVMQYVCIKMIIYIVA